MHKLNDPDYLLNEQYQDAGNLNARIRLHIEFSTNKYGWFPWVFDRYDLPEKCRILELGCGPGDLWGENMHRISPGWEITLSDFSPGMLEKAQQNLAGETHPFAFKIIDAQSIPYDAKHFDAVIANHFLYHVPDRPKALSEIQRFLKDEGLFFCSTVEENHLHELPKLLAKFDPNIESVFRIEENHFTLEKGKPQLQEWFSHVELHRYPDDLLVTEADALVDYVLSSVRSGLDENNRDDFKRFIEQEMTTNGGKIHIKKDSGMFKARKLRKKS